jgi:hypothetical protein
VSRAADGTYTLPVGSMNPAVTGTAISSTDFNALADDIEAALTDSLSRSGKGGMTAAMTFDAGSNAAPGITFTGDLDTGIYHPAANEVAVTVGGTQVAKFTASTTTLSAPLTKGSLPATGQQVSASSGAFTTSSNFAVDVTNLTVTITTTGRPVVLVVQPDGTSPIAAFEAYGTGDSAGTVKFLRGASTIAEFLAPTATVSATASLPALLFVDAVAAGTYTYKVQAFSTNVVGVLHLSNAVLMAYEL